MEEGFASEDKEKPLAVGMVAPAGSRLPAQSICRPLGPKMPPTEGTGGDLVRQVS